MKHDNFRLAAIFGAVGAMLAYLTSGLQAAQGLILGAAAGTVYIVFLHRDVDAAGGPSQTTPFDMFNPLRAVRLVIPLLLVASLALVSALSVGFDSWLDNVNWKPGVNFTGVVASPSALYGALLGYVAATATPMVGAIVRNLPEARNLAKSIPGSIGVAVKLGDKAKANSQKASKWLKGPVAEVPVLLISGPRGCGKSTLARRLRQLDPRFHEPQWVTTGPVDRSGESEGANWRILQESEFKRLSEGGDLAVSYRPYGDDGEQISVGLPVAAVLAAAAEGACILDVDPPTARTLLQYPWSDVLSAASPSQQFELRFVTVWVSLRTVDDVMERNRALLQATLKVPSAVERQLKPLRVQVSTDMEWAVTSTCFDFFVFNEDEERATEEVLKTARYCFKDPF